MVRILSLFLLITNISFAQKTDTLSVNPVKADSLKKVVIDSTRKLSIVNKFFKTDTVRKKTLLSRVFKADSAQKANPARKALIRSLILPGWGQATNREYWIMPIIYAAAAGGIYTYYVNDVRYKYYKARLTDIVIGGKTEVKVYPYIGIGTNQAKEEIGPFTQAQIEPVVNSYRRYRDLTVIVFAVGWALQAVQANVSAHLKTFDMSDDISLKFEPGIQSTPLGNAYGASIVFRF
jgi:hypothetical protein